MKLTLSLLVGFMLTFAGPAIASENGTTAASLAFTSKDAIVVQALDLMKSGRFKEAEALLETNANASNSDIRRARQETREIIRRTRLEYSLDAAGLLAKVKKSIPDATAAEVEQWAKDSQARFRMIDGQKLFFRREPQNIFLFSGPAKQRRAKAGNAPVESKWKLTQHLQAIVTEAERTGADELEPVRHQVTHIITVHANAPGVKAGSLLRVWFPYPQEYRQQRDVKFISASPQPTLIAPSAIEGNPVAAGAQRTVYFEQRVTDPAQPLEFRLKFEYNSYAYYPRLDPAKTQPLPANWKDAYLGERLPHLAFTPEIRRQTAQIVGAETNPLTKALKIFRWVSANVPWNAEDEYGIIPSLAVKGFTARRGDCGVQNSVFVTMCRIAGIPARWQSGFETKPQENWGMHDWAEIYVAPWGWLPADASYGVQDSKDPRIADFYCGHQDSYRMIVNLDWGRDLIPPKQDLRSEPADFQRGEVEVDGKNLYFDQWDYQMEIQRDPGPNPE